MGCYNRFLFFIYFYIKLILKGPSSGQGRQFAIQFAKRGFNLFLIGSQRTQNVINEINQLFPNIKIILVVKDFGKAFEKDFFNEIKLHLYPLTKQHKISILVNNVGHRAGWIPYHEMPEEIIRDTISCGTMVQAVLSKILLPCLLERQTETLKSAMIFITAQTVHTNFGLGNAISNDIYLPYLSVYEGANNFGFTHANSLFKVLIY